MEIGVVSTNASKAVEIKETLKELLPHLSVRTLFDFPGLCLPVDEPNEPLSQRALKKALFASKEAKIPCIAEEWSLHIPILNEQVRHAVFSLHSQKEQVTALLTALTSFKTESERSAYIESHLAIATPKGTHKVVTARIEGWIAEKSPGKSSFDFDSIFVKLGYAKPLAELSTQVRRKISSRRKALERALSFLESCATL